jgi:hypothetical protein
MDRRKRFYFALAMYAVLGVLIWFTMSDVPLPIGGYNLSISFRRLTLGILALFIVRTVLHWRAEEIRAERDGSERQSDESR